MPNLTEQIGEKEKTSTEKIRAAVAHDKIGDFEMMEAQFEATKKETAKNAPVAENKKEQEISAHDSEELQDVRRKLGINTQQQDKEKEPIDQKIVRQEWEIMCESVVKSFFNDEFLEYENRSPLEKIQEFLGSNYRNKPTHEMAFGSTKLPTDGLFEQLLPLFKKGITTSREIFQANPKIRSYFDVPQLWKEAEQRARER